MNKEMERYRDIVNNDFPQLIQMLERVMDFKRWGFRQTFAGVSEQFTPSIIYDSEKCRVRFLWYAPDVRDEPTIYVRYGRAHALNNQRYITRDGQQCYCWHNHRMALHFLEGLTPQEAMNNRYKWPRTLEKWEQSISAKGLPAVEGQVRIHAALWDHYGERLFNLFDLRHPELWDKCILFMKACYKIDPFTDDYGYLKGYEIC